MSHDPFECFALPWPQYRAWFARHRDELVGRAPFYQPAWLEALAAALHFDLAPIGIERAGDLIAVVPGFLTQRGPFRLFGSPLRGTMTSYLGPIGCLDLRRPELRRELVEHANAFARRHWRVSYTEFALRGPAASTVPDAGWEAGRPGSYQIDLSPGEDALWTALRPRARRQIRKSQQLGLEVSPFAGDAGDYYAMVLETFGRREATVWHPERFFRALFERLIPAGIVRVWSVRYKGETISAGIFVQDDREMHYVSGASRTAYRMLPTSYLMHWHAIRTAADAGAAIYDFGGTGTPSICEFKESFSPKRVEYWHLRWASAPTRLARRVFLAAERRVRPLRTLRRQVRARRAGRGTPRAPA
ncbi:MAG: GNAT family N-acetyltransferase [Gemmatimonadaceae bacterium]|nr:GNAT family N-acetyltransferase [Gemmatimonadaceae bacterium]